MSMGAACVVLEIRIRTRRWRGGMGNPEHSDATRIHSMTAAGLYPFFNRQVATACTTLSLDCIIVISDILHNSTDPVALCEWSAIR